MCMQLGARFCRCAVLLPILLLFACKLHAQWNMPTFGKTATVCSPLLSLSFTPLSILLVCLSCSQHGKWQSLQLLHLAILVILIWRNGSSAVVTPAG